MNTPIHDFLKNYRAQSAIRLHMPGHKGNLMPDDITEIEGADSLYAPSGIIAESEKNASHLFGAQTIYSTEGASQCIRAMVYLATLYAKASGKEAHILAGRNAHRAFLSAASLCDTRVTFLYGNAKSILACPLSAETVDAQLSQGDYTALYITSPDYLGNCTDIAALSAVCKKHGVLLLVDNAHGAYFRFLPHRDIPTALGADLACSSAHKTLPVLTGGAYLHISNTAPPLFADEARRAMVLFGSTSPSYLILNSLDCANALLSSPEYLAALKDLSDKTAAIKKALTEKGFALTGDEPLKITVCPKSYGYTGDDVAAYLAGKNIVSEFHDPDFIVFMVASETKKAALSALCDALFALPRKKEITEKPPEIPKCERVLSIREAAFAPSETVSAKDSIGSVLAEAGVSCPPAVPIVICGERIHEKAAEAFQYYGITQIQVVKEKALF